MQKIGSRVEADAPLLRSGGLHVAARQASDRSTESSLANRPAKQLWSDPLRPSLDEGVRLLYERVRLTGHPPLVTRSDLSGEPDFFGWGLPPHLQASFYLPYSAEQPTDGSVPYSLSRYVIRSEDAIRDVVTMAVGSKGQTRKMAPHSPYKGAAHGPDVWGEKTDGSPRIVCKTSPVTAPYWCAAAVNAAYPDPSSRPGLLLLDVGSTGGGYYGLLAASLGVRSLVVDPQPQCAREVAAAAGASGLGDKVTVLNAWAGAVREGQAFDPAARLAVPRSTGCAGTSVSDPPPSARRVRDRMQARAEEQLAAAKALAEKGRETNAADWIPPSASEVLSPDALANATVSVPLVRLSDVVGEGELVLVAKIDAGGREESVLAGLWPLLEKRRVLSLLLEFNKLHKARAMGLESAKKAGNNPDSSPAPSSLFWWELDNDRDPDASSTNQPIPFDLSEADNSAVASSYASLVRRIMSLGYEVLTSDRGWWAAQDPFRHGREVLSDGATLDGWAEKMHRRGEMDVWFYLPATITPGV